MKLLFIIDFNRVLKIRPATVWTGPIDHRPGPFPDHAAYYRNYGPTPATARQIATDNMFFTVYIC